MSRLFAARCNRSHAIAIVRHALRATGHPAEALALALAVDVVADFHVTAFEQVCPINTLVKVSSELDMIDAVALRAS